MHTRSASLSIRLLILFLALIVLGAQSHFCADSAGANSGSHLCQVCATAGHAVTQQSLIAEFSPIVTRFETSSPFAEVTSISFATTSPRAPPTDRKSTRLNSS